MFLRRKGESRETCEAVLQGEWILKPNCSKVPTKHCSIAWWTARLHGMREDASDFALFTNLKHEDSFIMADRLSIIFYGGSPHHNIRPKRKLQASVSHSTWHYGPRRRGEYVKITVKRKIFLVKRAEVGRAAAVLYNTARNFDQSQRSYYLRDEINLHIVLRVFLRRFFSSSIRAH